MIKILEIYGNSLYPLLREGERVVCFKIFKINKINIGDFVIFNKNPYGLMIKRVKLIKDGKYFVQGTDPSSIDSRDFGFLDFCDIRYKMYFKI